MTEVELRRASRLAVRSRILDAATRLLHEHGADAVTTRRVAQVAGVQAPAIYRLFGDKEGLLDAVAEHELARYIGDKSLAFETGDPVADLRDAWSQHIRFGLANPSLYAILAEPARAARAPIAAAGLDILRARVHRIAVTGRLRVSERRAVDLIHAAGVGAVLTLLAAPVEDRDLHVADLLYDAVMRTVLVDAPTLTTDHTYAAAVALRAAAPQLPRFSAAERILLSEWLDRLTAE